jgi:diguanylate cyclase (GGDEF)-like protein
MSEARIDRQIEENHQLPFAVVIFDVNDLKKVNDTAGHQAGDQYLREACKIICEIFKHSPVFRVGGNEFVVISQGEDYARVEELTALIEAHNKEALRSGGVVVACGMSRFDSDDSVAAVFERADRMMYENKSLLKASGL